ncbi:MAG: hypothetical protein KGY56_15015 [Desulfobacterales bacterium]|nr:hypothetical protein [Desulfobacterales bacterium]
MRKSAYCIWIIALLAGWLLLGPATASADLKSLSEAEMESISGQAGIAIHTEGVEFETTADVIALGNPGEDKSAVFMSLCGVEIKGSVHMKNPLEITTTTGPNPYTDKPVTSVNIRMDGVVMKTDRFVVDAIRVGPEPGKGPSFGSLYIKGMHSEISGNISIWAL